MLGKISRKSLVNSFHKAKNFIGHAYNTTKHVLSNVDNGVKLFKHVYSVAHPLIDQLRVVKRLKQTEEIYSPPVRVKE